MTRFFGYWLALLVAVPLILSISARLEAQLNVPPLRAQPLGSDDYFFHEIYYRQPHNTYKHGRSLDEWLDAGFRSVELDVVDRDFWFQHADGPYVSHGYALIDLSNCRSVGQWRLGPCLDTIRAWVERNPEAVPLVVFIDMKSNASDLVTGGHWSGSTIAFLDRWIADRLGDRLFSYADLISYAKGRSSAESPRKLVAEAGWPPLSQMRGKIVVALTGGRVLSVNQQMAEALANAVVHGAYPKGFLCPDVESDPAELLVGGKIDGISLSYSQYFLCSNLQSRDHYQVTANVANRNKQLIHLWGDHVFANDSFTYNYIAIAHGIQAVGQDIDSPSDATTFGGSLPFVGVRRSLPGYFRVRPSDNPALCMDVEGESYSNGADVQQTTCNSSFDKQYVYTAEGQLRPRANNRYCVDVDGGRAKNGAKLHLWDCDGGPSEKWLLTPGGHFRNASNLGYCMDARASHSSGADWQTYRCGNIDQRIFWLEPVADWFQTIF